MTGPAPLIDWPTEIGDRFAHRPVPVQARTFIKRWPSASSPFLVTASDQSLYVVKSGCAGRQIVNDQIVGRLGEAIGAPTGRVALIEVTQELIDNSPELQQAPIRPGIWHASKYVDRHSDDREGILHTNLPENRPRFARLAALYGWAYAGGDHQFLYAKDPPPLALSVDHGHFFPSGPEWTEASITSFATLADADPIICGGCSLSPDEIKEGVRMLVMSDPVDVIATAVAIPLDDWQIQMSERVAMANYLYRRREEIVTAHAP